MTREELEAELLKIHDYDMTMYDMWRAVHLGIRYGFEKAREKQIPFWESDEDSNYWVLESKYDSAEEVIQELDKEQEPVLGREARMQQLRDEIKELLAEDKEQDDKR